MSVARPAMAGEPRIDTTRLVLQPSAITDAEELFDAYGDVEAMRYWDTPRMRTIAEMTEMLTWVLGPGRTDTSLMWSVRERSAGRIVGMVSYHHLERWHHRADISFLFARQHWGKGFAKEALNGLIDYCFERMHLHRLVALVDLENEKSHGLVQRLGFQREGVLIEHICAAGRFRTVVLYGLIASGRPARNGPALEL